MVRIVQKKTISIEIIALRTFGVTSSASSSDSAWMEKKSVSIKENKHYLGFSKDL